VKDLWEEELIVPDSVRVREVRSRTLGGDDSTVGVPREELIYRGRILFLNTFCKLSEHGQETVEGKMLMTQAQGIVAQW
jgi:hypothetical protein